MTSTTTHRPTEPLRIEHRELLPEIEALGTTADELETASEADARGLIARAYDFLANHLIPHALAEDAVLYPAVERAMTAPGATDTMRRDHTQAIHDVELLRAELDDPAPLDAERRRRIRRLLYGLNAVVSLHFAKEEEIYLEVLDRALQPAEAAEMFAQMEEAAAVAKR